MTFVLIGCFRDRLKWDLEVWQQISQNKNYKIEIAEICMMKDKVCLSTYISLQLFLGFLLTSRTP